MVKLSVLIRNRRTVFPDNDDFAFSLTVLLMIITSKIKSVGVPTDLFLSDYEILVISNLDTLHILKYEIWYIKISCACAYLDMRLHFAVEIRATT